MEPLLQTEAQTRDLMVQKGGFDPEGVLFIKGFLKKTFFPEPLPFKGPGGAEKGLSEEPGMDLDGQEIQGRGEIFDEIPGIGGEPVFQLIDEMWRAEKAKQFFSPQTKAQETIKPDKMIHVGVTDKDVGKAQDLTGRHRPYFTKIKEYGPAGKFYINI